MGEIKTKSNADAALKTGFGATVKNLRHRLGYSQEQLALRADMHRTYLADIERGGRNISLFSIVRLVNALDTSLAHFFQKLEKNFTPPNPLRSLRRRSAVAHRPQRTSRPRR